MAVRLISPMPLDAREPHSSAESAMGLVDGELDGDAFQAWLDACLLEDDLESIAQGFRRLHRKHEPAIGRALLDLERKQPLLRSQSREVQATLALSRVVRRLVQDYTPTVANLLVGVGTLFRDHRWYHRGVAYFDELTAAFAAREDLLLLAQSLIWGGAMRTGLKLSFGEEHDDIGCYSRALAIFQDIHANPASTPADRHEAGIGLALVQHHYAFLANFDFDNGELERLYLYRALAIFELLEDREHVSRTWSNLAQCFWLKKDHGRALLHFVRGMRVDPLTRNPTARLLLHHNFAKLASSLKELGIARRLGERGLSFDPYQFRLIGFHAETLVKLGEPDRAVVYLERLLSLPMALFPADRAKAFDLLINVHRNAGRTRDADHAIDRFLDWIVADRGLFQVAGQHMLARIELKLGATDPGNHVARAILLNAKGDSEGARRELDQALHSQAAPLASEARTEIEKLRQTIASRADDAETTDPEAPPPSDLPATPSADMHGTGCACRACARPCEVEGLPAAQWIGAFDDETGTGRLACPRCASVFTMASATLESVDCPRCGAGFRVPCRQTPGGDPRDVRVDGLCRDCREALTFEDLVAIPSGKLSVAPFDQHPIRGFLMDRCPITNRLFRIYRKVCGLEWQPATWRTTLFSTPQQPVTSISVIDAMAFCAWRSKLREQTVRLPTRAEWVWAALGDQSRTYPWGDTPPDHTRAFFALAEDADAIPAPVGLFPAGASPFGVLDMAGNVWEMTSGPGDDSDVVLLGGGCGSESYALSPRVALNLETEPLASDSRSRWDVGFRCVIDVEDGD